MSTVEILTKKQPFKPVNTNTQAHAHPAPARGATRPTPQVVPLRSPPKIEDESYTEEEEEVQENGYYTPEEDEEGGDGGGVEKLMEKGQKCETADWTEYMYSSKSWADMVEEEEIENMLKNENSQVSALSNNINEINDSKNTLKSMKNDCSDSIESMRRPHFSGSSSNVSGSASGYYQQRNRTNGYFGRSHDSSMNSNAPRGSTSGTGQYNGSSASSGYNGHNRSGAFSGYNGQNNNNNNNNRGIGRGNLNGSGNRLNSSASFRNNGYHHSAVTCNAPPTTVAPLSPRLNYRDNSSFNNTGPKGHFRTGSNGRINTEDKENFNEDKENIKNMKPIKKRKYGTKFPKNGRETEPHRIEQRQKQINFGKNTEGYKNYIVLVPKHLRQKTHPQTPNPYALCSKRNWDRQVRTWRRALHLWDSEPSSKEKDESDIENDENDDNENDEDDSDDDYTPLKSDMPPLDDIPLSDQEILVSLKI